MLEDLERQKLPSLEDRLTKASLAKPGTQEASELPAYLRSVGNRFLDAWINRRIEDIQPLQSLLHYTEQVVSRRLAAKDVIDSPEYALGKIDALIELCALGVERLYSESHPAKDKQQ